MELGISERRFCINNNSVRPVQLPIAGVNLVKLLSSTLRMFKRFNRPIEFGRESRQLCDSVRSVILSNSLK